MRQQNRSCSEDPNEGCKIDSVHQNDGIVATHARAVATIIKEVGFVKVNDVFSNNFNAKSLHAFNIYYYYMANQVLGKSLCSYWFFLGRIFQYGPFPWNGPACVFLFWSEACYTGSRKYRLSSGEIVHVLAPPKMLPADTHCLTCVVTWSLRLFYVRDPPKYSSWSFV